MGLKKVELVREWQKGSMERDFQKVCRNVKDGKGKFMSRAKVRNERNEIRELFTREGGGAHTIV